MNLSKMLLRKTICIAINSLEMGGAEKQSVLLAKALNPYHNVILIVVDPKKEIYGPRLKTLKSEDIETIFLKKNIFLKIKRLTTLFKKKRVDIIFSFLATDTILSTVCGKLTNVPYIIGGLRSSSWPRLKFFALRTNHNYFLSYTISNNFAGYHTALKFGFRKNMFVIPNGIEIRPLKKNSNNSETIEIISMGRLVELKRYDIAIKAIANLKKYIKGSQKIKYRIVGQGPEEENIIEMIKNYGVSQEVEVITNASNTYDLLEQSDIYLSTSSFEGISNALMEAMNCALPLVATNVGNNSYLVKDGVSGFLVDEGDYKQLSKKLFVLIESSSTRYQMGLEGYNHLVENFSFKAFQKKYLKLIENLDDFIINKGEISFKEEENIS